MSVSYWQEPGVDARQAERAHVVIIGAGIIGAYTALRLAEAGHQPVVIEARHPAAGATGRNAGMMLSGVAENYYRALERYGPATARELWSLTYRNREIMWQLINKTGATASRCGSIVLASDAQEAQELRQAAALLRDQGFAGEFHDSDPLNRGFAAAISNPDDGVLNPAELVHGLLRISKARLLAGHEVYALESTDAGVLVRARGMTLLAQVVILATNAYTPLIEPTLTGLIIPQRNQVVVTAPNSPVLSVACYANRGYEYFRQLPDGRFLIGGCRNCDLEAESTYADATTPAVQSALEDRLARYFPDVTAPIERRWSGTMGFTPDGLPLVGRLARDERIAYAVGFNGHGLGLGVVAVDSLLSLLRGGTAGLFAAERLTSAAAA